MVEQAFEARLLSRLRHWARGRAYDPDAALPHPAHHRYWPTISPRGRRIGPTQRSYRVCWYCGLSASGRWL